MIQIPGMPSVQQPTMPTVPVDPQSAAAPAMALARGAGGALSDISDVIEGKILQVYEVENWKAVEQARGMMRNGFKQWQTDAVEQGLAPHEMGSSWDKRAQDLQREILEGMPLSSSARDRLTPEVGEFMRARQIDVAEAAVVEGLRQARQVFDHYYESAGSAEEKLALIDRTPHTVLPDYEREIAIDDAHKQQQEEQWQVQALGNLAGAAADVAGDDSMPPDEQAAKMRWIYQQANIRLDAAKGMVDAHLSSTGGQISREDIEAISQDVGAGEMPEWWYNAMMDRAVAFADGQAQARAADPEFQNKLIGEVQDLISVDPEGFEERIRNKVAIENRLDQLPGNMPARGVLEEMAKRKFDRAEGLARNQINSLEDQATQAIDDHFKPLIEDAGSSQNPLVLFQNLGFGEDREKLEQIGFEKGTAKKIASAMKDGDTSEARRLIYRYWDPSTSPLPENDYDRLVIESIYNGESVFTGNVGQAQNLRAQQARVLSQATQEIQRLKDQGVKDINPAAIVGSLINVSSGEAAAADVFGPPTFGVDEVWDPNMVLPRRGSVPSADPVDPNISDEELIEQLNRDLGIER